MLLRDPPEHGRLRATVSRAFSAAHIARLTTTIESVADRALDELQSDGEVNLIDAFAAPLPVAVIGHLLGVPVTDTARFRTQSRRIADAIDMRESSAPCGPAAHVMQEWIAELRGQLAARRKRPREDLLSALLAARTSDGALRDQELLAMATLLLFTAQETTSDLIGNGVLALLRHPQQQRALAQDPALMPGAVEEMLRFDAPVQCAIIRTASCDLELGGKTIRKGDSVVAVRC